MIRIGPLTALLIASAIACAPAQAADRLVGRPVAEVLDEAIRQGAKIVYSSQRVPADLRVLSEPSNTDTLARLRAVLAQHGLTLQSAAGGVSVVVPARAQDESAMSPAGRRPLDGDSASLPEITVISSRYTLLAPSPSPPLTLDTLDMQTQPALLDDALRAIRRFPGTAGTPYSSKTHVRGGDTNENLVVLDGVPLTAPFRLEGFPADLSLIDPSIVGKVDFYSGVFPIEYGGRMSSVTHLRSRHATRPFGGRLGLGFVNASALLEGTLPRDNGDWLVALRRGTLELIARAVEPEFVRPALLDAFATARYKIGARSTVSFGVLSADDDVQFSELDGSESTTAESDRAQMWLSLDSEWRNMRVLTRVFYDGSDLERTGFVDDDENAVGDLHDNRSMRAVALSQDWRMPVHDVALRWGWSFEDMDVGYDYRKTTDFALQTTVIFGPPPFEDFEAQLDSGAQSHAAYAGVEWNPTNAIAVDMGARWEHHDYETGQRASRVDPRVSLMYRFSPRSRVRLAWGRLSQFASGAELPVERGLLSYDEPARAALSVLGWDYEVSRERFLRVELYDKRVQDPWPRLESLLNPIVLVPELRPDQVLIAPESARGFGIDIHLFGKLGERWRGWLSYSGARAYDEFASGSRDRSWDQRHALAVGLSRDLWSWNWTAALTAHSGWPTTAVEISPTGFVGLGPRNGKRWPWYATLDFKAQRSFDLSRGVLRFSAELTNATGRSNVCCSTLDFEDAPAQARQKSWLPMVPLLNAAWEF